MPHPYPYTMWLTDQINRHLGQLADHLAHAPSGDAVRLIARILHPEDGVLAGVSEVVATGSRHAKTEAERGALPPEVWLALGRAANELDAIATDLGEHRDVLRRAAAPHASAVSALPAPAPLVVRRHR